MKVLVCHPGRQHSHQAALALQAAGMLAGYWTGIPCFDKQRLFLPKSIWQKCIRYAPVELEPGLVKWNPIAPLIHKLTSCFNPTLASWFEYQGYWAFDRWAARQLGRLNPRPDAVIGYENSSLKTFNMAKRLGIKTILDAAALHHKTQDRFYEHVEKPLLHKRIATIKDQEIALTDHVLVLSDLALRSYLGAGVEAKRLHKLALGVDTEFFQPTKDIRDHESFKFIFIGGATRHKGIDLLFQAFEQALKAHPGAQLTIIGHFRNEWKAPRRKYPNSIWFSGALSQKQLAEEYRHADCLILPSRHDSFGMVVLEALSSGLPVIVSDHVGAKDCVAEGQNGWIVPAGNAEMLAERMAWCLCNPIQVRLMKEQCRALALRANWINYHNQLVELMKGPMTRSEFNHD